MSTSPVFDVAFFAPYDSHALRALIAAASIEEKRRNSVEREHAVAQILDIAKSVGLPVAELIGKIRAPMPKVAARYACPSDPSLTWTGRGRQPVWVVNALAAGTPLASMTIGGANMPSPGACA